MSVASEARDIGRLFRDFGYFRGSTYLLLVFFIIAFPSFVIGRNNSITNHEQTCDNYCVQNQSAQEVPKSQNLGQVAAAMEKRREDNLNWIINKKRIYEEKDSNGEKTGFYCVQASKNFDADTISYPKKIPIGSRIKLRYLLKTDPEQRLQHSPKFIVALYSKPIFRLFFPDQDTGRIQLEDNTKNEATINQWSNLPKRIDVLKETTLDIAFGTVNSNVAIISYTLNYISELDQSNEQKALTYQDSFTARFPFADPNSDGSEQEISVGAFNGTCFKIISFAIVEPNS